MLVEVEVKRPVSIPGGEKSRAIDLRPGIVKIDDAVFSHWYVAALFNNGSLALVKRKVNNFKSLEQIVAEKKALQTQKEEKKVEAPVVFATHATMQPVGTELDVEAKKEDIEETKKIKTIRRKRS